MDFKRFFLLILIPGQVLAQSSNINLNRDYYHLMERYEIMSGKFPDTYHTNTKPFRRDMVGRWIDSLYHNKSFVNNLTARDRFNMQYLANDNWEWSKSDTSKSVNKPFLKVFYRKKTDLYHVQSKDFDLHVNPVLYLSAGTESESDVTTYINTRGVDIRGSIAQKIGFYTYMTTTQAVYPKYVRDWTDRHGVIPGEGFWKDFKESGVDYFTAKGYITFQVVKNYIQAQFGFDQSFIGTGHRSMILSDAAPGYTYLKFNTRIWKFNYTNLFAQLYADQYYSGTGSLDGKYPKKFLASHHLSIDITKKLNIGVFESVVIGDSTERFDIGYLNPIIFYRALEHQGGSSENVIVGMDARWNIGHALSLYGQLVLDEFLLKEIKAGNGWWANKFGGQVGMKYINTFGIDNLDLQLEYNVARPYLYTHQDIYNNYAHYRQSLGHGFGGNFHEFLGVVRYQPLNRIYLTAQINIANYGDDQTPEINWGKEVMKSYDTRVQDYDNKIGQGVTTNLLYSDLTISYMWKHNLFFDIRGIYRKLDSDLDERDANTTYFSAAMRWNIGRKIHDL